MAETEVESVLREIRERVITQQRSGQGLTTGAGGSNGDSGPSQASVTQTSNRATIAENLALINSYLTTTARAWDRLPPVVSNRSGLLARLELWCKRQLKRGTRWYAWEQVNFNAAVHHALRDLLPLLSAYERELENLRAETIAAQRGELTALREELVGFRAELLRMRAELSDQRAETVAALQAQSDLRNAQNVQVQAKLKDLIDELRERDEILRAEQRVCFKQLSLQTAEAATLEDRARRKIEMLVTELQNRIDELEKNNE